MQNVHKGHDATDAACSPQGSMCRLTNGQKHVVLPHGLRTRTSLYAHQIVGVSTMIREAQRKGYFALLDACGLGKTVQCLYAGSDLLVAKFVQKIIVVCKADLVEQWREHFQLHVPSLKVQVLYGKPPKDRRWCRKADVHIINYDLLAQPARGIKKLRIRSRITGKVLKPNIDAMRMYVTMRNYKCGVILDESQRIKTPSARTTEILCALAPLAVFRFIATATLEAEDPLDAWSQIFFLDGGKLLGKSYRAFESKYAVHETREFWQRVYNRRSGEYEPMQQIVNKVVGFQHLGELRKLISTVSLRRKKEQCLDLPPKIEKMRVIDATGKQLMLLRSIRDELATHTKQAGEYISLQPGSSIASLMQRLQRAVAMPCLIDSNVSASAKFMSLLEVLDETSEQVVVWCVHRNVVDAVEEQMQERKLKSVVAVHGGTPKTHRVEFLKSFKQGKSRVLVCTGDALREGHNFQNAAHSVIFQPTWSRLTDVQSQERLHRIGQTKTVIVERLVLEQSLDRYMLQRLRSKNVAAEYQTGSKDYVLLRTQELRDALAGW